MTVQRILLIINRTSGTGNDESVAARLRSTIVESLGQDTSLTLEMVVDHPSARRIASSFLADGVGPAAIIAGGGGGTLRAVIEGVCDRSAQGNLPGADRIRIAALRMGSGNVLAKQFGVPLDPEVALKGIVANLHSDRTAPCCVLRCESLTASGETEVHHAATLGGFGQFGRVPGDLARWHRRLPLLHKAAARALRVERLTDLEYVAALLIRCLWCILFPGTAETIEWSLGNRREVSHLLSGLAMNFPLKAIPFEPGVRVEEEAWSLHLIPLLSRFTPLLVATPRRLAKDAVRIRMEKTGCVEMKLVSRKPVEFFLDEDPMLLVSQLKLQVAGSLAFVPGPDYIWAADR